MKTCLTFAAALVALAAGAEIEKSNPFATPDESSVVMGTPPKGAESLAADPRYRARHYEIDIPEGEYWWGGEVLEASGFHRAARYGTVSTSRDAVRSDTQMKESPGLLPTRL